MGEASHPGHVADCQVVSSPDEVRPNVGRHVVRRTNPRHPRRQFVGLFGAQPHCEPAPVQRSDQLGPQCHSPPEVISEPVATARDCSPLSEYRRSQEQFEVQPHARSTRSALSQTNPTRLSLCQTSMKAMPQQLQSDLCVAAATEQPQHRPSLPKLDVLAVDADVEPPSGEA